MRTLSVLCEASEDKPAPEAPVLQRAAGRHNPGLQAGPQQRSPTSSRSRTSQNNMFYYETILLCKNESLCLALNHLHCMFTSSPSLLSCRLQVAGEAMRGTDCPERGGARRPGLWDVLVPLPHGAVLPVTSLNPSQSSCPVQSRPLQPKLGHWQWAKAGAPMMGSGLHKPRFSGKVAKNSRGRCATGCTLPVPGLFYIAAALGLQPRLGTTPAPRAGLETGTFVRSGEVTRRIGEVSVSLSPVRRFVP